MSTEEDTISALKYGKCNQCDNNMARKLKSCPIKLGLKEYDYKVCNCCDQCKAGCDDYILSLRSRGYTVSKNIEDYI